MGLSGLKLLFSQQKNNINIKNRPNIIFILADDLGYGDLGCYGQQKILTPNLNNMATQGVRFTQHYAGSAICAPSRCSLLTGKHTGHTDIRSNKEMNSLGEYPILDQTVTVAEILKTQGYIIGAIGKWGLGIPGTEGTPNKQGFDYFFGFYSQKRAHSHYPNYLWENDKKIYFKNNKWKRKIYSPDLFTKKALEFISNNQKKPFFLYLPYTIPHAELSIPFKYLKKYFGKFKERPYSGGLYRPQPTPRAAYAAMVTKLDEDIGIISEHLKKLNLDNNTIIFFSSDNGPHNEGGNTPKFFNSTGGLRGIKRDLYEGGIRIPLIVKWPDEIKKAIVTDHISAFWDFLPTICDILDIKPPDNIDGISYLPTLLNQPQKEHEYLYWELYGLKFKRAVRINNWKAIQIFNDHKNNAAIELYNLKNDPGESINSATEFPGIIEKVKNIFNKAHTSNKLYNLDAYKK